MSDSSKSVLSSDSEKDETVITVTEIKTKSGFPRAASNASKTLRSAIKRLRNDEDEDDFEFNDDFEGSVWDELKREVVNVEDLDLHVVYPPRIRNIKRPKRQYRWKHTGLKPLTDPRKIPQGWNMREPDLDLSDYDAQIQRCYERIQDNILPDKFRPRLEEYLRAKAKKDAEIANEGAGDLSWDVVRRLQSLQRIHQDISVPGNEKYVSIRNVEAIIAAYRSKQLVWSQGNVTYWSHGVQLCQPRPFKWDEFEAIYDKHQGIEGFWVEGRGNPGPGSARAARNTFHENPEIHSCVTYPMAMRVDRFAADWQEFEVMFDTGASSLHIFESDIRTMLGPQNPSPLVFPRFLGIEELAMADNRLARFPVVEVQVTCLGEDGTRITPWIRNAACVQPGLSILGNYRIDGPFLRRMLYVAYPPDNSGDLYVANQRKHLNLPRSRHCPQEQRSIDGEIMNELLQPDPARGETATSLTLKGMPGPDINDRRPIPAKNPELVSLEVLRHAENRRNHLAKRAGERAQANSRAEPKAAPKAAPKAPKAPKRAVTTRRRPPPGGLPTIDE